MNKNDYIIRFKVIENVKEGSSAVNEDKSVYDARKKQNGIKYDLEAHLKEKQATWEIFKKIVWYGIAVSAITLALMGIFLL